LKYEGYIRRQEDSIERARSNEEKQMPDMIDFNQITGLRPEARQKLSSIRPRTLGQALRISGITPADIALLTVWLRKSGGVSTSEKTVPK
jgi:tRNA uridine 5-carboxymethylaminomethyl modification enzyme